MSGSTYFKQSLFLGYGSPRSISPFTCDWDLCERDFCKELCLEPVMWSHLLKGSIFGAVAGL